jgi:multidrug efflux system membrane fusion protein
LLLVGSGAWWWLNPQFGAATNAETKTAGGGNAGRRFGGANRVQPVSVSSAKIQDIRVVLSAIGNIAALNTATVRTHVDGELKAIHFKDGQLVRAGAILADIDPRSFEIQLAQAQGQLARDAAQLRNAQLDLERYKELLGKDSIAKQQVDTQDTLVLQLNGTVQSDQAQVDNAKLLLAYTKVTAPISGRLGFKQADLGNLVKSTDTAGLVTITQTQPISVVFAVPESNLPQINSKLKAGEAMVVEAWDREQKIKLAIGKVSSTDNAIDLTTGSIKLKAEFPNSDNTLFPNQFVNIRLQVDTLMKAVVVPASAIQRGAQGIFVYVINEDSTVAVRRVRLGVTEGDWVSIQGEVAAGEQVITDGADRLRDGAKVEVITPAQRSSAVSAVASAVSAPQPPSSSAREGKPSARSVSAPISQKFDATGERPKGQPTPAERSASEGTERPRWMDRLPPEMLEKVKAMNPDERREFLQKLRERRRSEGQSE